MNTSALRFEHRQSQTLTPRLQHAVRLLQLSSLDFAQEVHNAMGRNPFLEPDEAFADAGEEASAAQSGEMKDDAHHTSDAALTDAPLAVASDDTWERDSWQQTSSSVRANGAGDSDTSAMEMMPASATLREHLRSQANMLPLSARDHVLVCAVIESLDDDGYLRLGLDELAELAELDPAVDECEMNTALKLVQSLEPCGVGARDIAECLLLQLQNAQGIDEPLARLVLTHHLDKLAQRDVPGLAKLLARTTLEIDTVFQRIRQLDPRPGWRFGGNDVQFVTPDVIVRKVRGAWGVQLNPAIVPKVKLNNLYADLFQRHRDAKHTELAAHLQEARWTLRNVQQRFSTIVMVADAILKRQHHFLEYGPLAMKPMGLREIADEVGLHESTVCRVTNNKFMATPVGVFELKYFFSRAMPTASGGSCSPTAIRGVIKDLIGAENPVSPLSDVDIARQLARQGLTVARRTITKYRQLLKLPAADLRRRHA